MPQRGYTRVKDSEGRYPYEEFQIDAGADVYITLTANVDGTDTPLDVSAPTIKVYLRAAKRTTTAVPISVEMTKRTGSVSDGDTGKVQARATFRAADWSADEFCDMGVYVSDEGTADTLTPSGFQETLWGNLWEAKVIGAIDA